MYTSCSLMFLYAVSPVHMGAGTAVGVVDNPIQREVHTGHPILAGSGLKGAMRDFARTAAGWSKAEIKRRFGPGQDVSENGATNASEHAGAVSVGDAQLVAFPVRSLKGAYVYATSAVALGRAFRLMRIAGLDGVPDATLPEPEEDAAVVIDDSLLVRDALVLGSYRFRAQRDSGALAGVAKWLAATALPQRVAWDFFREKLRRHLVLLPETWFSHFVRNATSVEAHVRINDATGTADDRGLFYTENVPPESLFASLVMASEERTGRKDGRESGDQILAALRQAFHEKVLQVGGDATTGRGQVAVRFAGGGA